MGSSNNNLEFSDTKVEYLKMIQEIVARMSTLSSNIKGFAVAVVAGVTALSFSNTSFIVLCFSFSSILFFLWLDVYYLSLERKYRFLYEEKRKLATADFILSLDFKESDIKNANATKWQCLTSKSIYYFYGPLIALAGILLVLKFNGVI